MNATFFQRLGAYFLDSIIISLIFLLICQCLPNTETEAEKKLKELDNQLQTGEITEAEYLDAYTNSELIYNIQKGSLWENSISVAITFVYFVLFQYMNKGQTIGKKLMKIRVVDKNTQESPTILKGLLRTLFTLSIFSGTFGILLLFIVDKTKYFTPFAIIYVIEAIFIFTTMIFMIYKKDGRGLHDIMTNTVVIKERG